MPPKSYDLPLPRRDDGDVELVCTLPAGTSDFGSQTKARVRAIDVLFEAEARAVDVRELAEDRQKTSPAQTPLPPVGKRLAELYADHAGEADDIISSHSEAWELMRMPAVDRAILRMGVTELMWGEDLAPAIIMKEYTRIAAALSTENSPAFVNALLQRVADMKELLQ